MNHVEQEMLDDLSNVFQLHAAAISKRDAVLAKRDAEMRALRDTLAREREGHRDALVERLAKRDAEMRALRATLTREREGHRDALVERDATIAQRDDRIAELNDYRRLYENLVMQCDERDATIATLTVRAHEADGRAAHYRAAFDRWQRGETVAIPTEPSPLTHTDLTAARASTDSGSE